MRTQLKAILAILLFSLALPLAGEQPKATDPKLATAISVPVIEPPEWVWTHLSHVYNVPTLEELDKAAAMGIQVVHGGPINEKDPQKLAAFKDLVGELHKRDIKIVPGGSLLYFKFDILREHPDWRVHWVDDPKLVENWKFDEHPKIRACLNSPYADYAIRELADFARESDVDGYSFDGSHLEVCYCKYCKEKYRQATGREIPGDLDKIGRTDGGDLKVAAASSRPSELSDPDVFRYFRWREQALVDFWVHMRTEMKKVRPDFAFLTWTVNAGRWGHLSGVPRVQPFTLNLFFDVPMQEWWFEESNRGGSIIPATFGVRLLRASGRERPTISNPYDFTHWEDLWQAGYGSSMPLLERKFRFLLAITQGSIPATVWGSPYKKGDFEPLTALVREREPYLIREKSVKWAGLVVSDDTRNFYGGSITMGRYIEHCMGAFRAMTEAHLPVDFVTDLDLEENRLGDYKVLILPNSACLSDNAVANIRCFVEKGGGLVATVESSRYDQDGNLRPDFALADVFGAHFDRMAEEMKSTGLPDAPRPVAEAGPWDSAGSAHGVIYWEGKAPEIVSDAVKDRTVYGAGFLGKCAVVRLADQATTGALIRLQKPSEDGYPTPSGVASAALVVNNFGSGRVAFFPVGIDQGYYAYPYPYQRMLLVNAANWAAGTPPPVRVEAPMCLQATFFTQETKKESRTIVHLLNTINTTGGKASPAGCDVPLREEIVPISDIRVFFEGAKPVRVHLEPGGQDLKVQDAEKGWSVAVPKLEMHSMVVVENR